LILIIGFFTNFKSSEIIDFAEYKSNIKKFAEVSWISGDIIQEYMEKGENYGG
jgi:hypothetical protein